MTKVECAQCTAEIYADTFGRIGRPEQFCSAQCREVYFTEPASPDRDFSASPCDFLAD